MKLSELLLNIEYKTNCNLDENIEEISINSKEKHSLNAVFVCLKGENSNSHQFAEDAVKNGAKFILAEHSVGLKNEIIVKNTRSALSKICANFNDNPQQKMKMIAITGTNGKTTTSYMIKSILEQSGHKVGLIGTEGTYICKQFFKSNLTTPDPLELFILLAKMVDFGCEFCVMEASAHALYYDKLDAIAFDVAIFSNLTQDHLDFFENMENYEKAKLKLFNKNHAKLAVLNFDDKVGRKIASICKLPVVSYGINTPADCFAMDINYEISSSSFVLNLMDNVLTAEINFPGDYNVYNALAASSACAVFGVTAEDIKVGLGNLKSIAGRFNIINLNNGAKAIVDFAHTPDGIEKVLLAIKQVANGRIITVFGCAGNRDKTKRPKMAQMAEKYSSFVIVTSDNPRFENPDLIIEDVEKGFLTDKFVGVIDRKKAIELAINLSRPGDILAILGKGAEEYQDINGIKVPYSDVETVHACDEKISKRMEAK
ncbi:MAG: UDP-N-acetylmuramoyl-L-alanyl-D-glutamate--2,6-diaminopimelate ligase [Clostridia bacterium]|nr:UDP-N-acetylmuramoyl-L-alanyl-D-glutamate--2,6-diaminopimelate ligase [Clostridia bacterium]